jgi:hypothetical protein
MEGHLGRASRRAPNVIFHDGGLPRSLLQAWNRAQKSAFFNYLPGRGLEEPNHCRSLGFRGLSCFSVVLWPVDVPAGVPSEASRACWDMLVSRPRDGRVRVRVLAVHTSPFRVQIHHGPTKGC